MRRLGIDPGSARTGLSLAEDGLQVAVPFRTLRHRSTAEAASQVASVVAQEQIGEVIVGLPLSMNGREGQAAKRARAFVQQLRSHRDVPVVFWDERLSTASAERALRAQGLKGRDQRAVVDQAAATLILQSYLDSQRDRTWHDEPGQVDDRNAHPRDARRDR